MRRSTFKVQGHDPSFRASFLSSFIPRPSYLVLRSSSPGFAYIALLVAIIIIGISLGAAGKYWSSVMLRDKEEELLFRGEQYRKAIDQYYYALPGRQQYPQSIDDLLKDGRSVEGKRHLRQKYKDPITGEDFVEIIHPVTKRIIGVHSSSDKEPLKQANFPATVLVPISAGTYPIPVFIPPRAPQSDDAGSGKIKYSDWLFYTAISTTTQPFPGGLPPGGFPTGGGFPLVGGFPPAPPVPPVPR